MKKVFITTITLFIISMFFSTALAQQPITNPVIAPSVGTGPGGSALAEVMVSVWRGGVMAGGLALLLYLSWGGIRWLTAGGDPANVEKARDTITQAIIGMGILVATIAIAIFLGTIFQIDLLTPIIPSPRSTSISQPSTPWYQQYLPTPTPQTGGKNNKASSGK